MLLNNFFEVIKEEREEGKLVAEISFNKNHPIFEGHFPGQPVVPGVCMLQIIKELLEQETGRSLLLSTASTSKFLNLIDPVQSPEVSITINYSTNEVSHVLVTATISKEATTFLKLSGASFV